MCKLMAVIVIAAKFNVKYAKEIRCNGIFKWAFRVQISPEVQNQRIADHPSHDKLET